VPGYPTGDNPATGLPWSPGTDGLRNLTGRVNPDGSVTIWAITSTVSGNGDQGRGTQQAGHDHRPAQRHLPRARGGHPDGADRGECPGPAACRPPRAPRPPA